MALVSKLASLMGGMRLIVKALVSEEFPRATFESLLGVSAGSQGKRMPGLLGHGFPECAWSWYLPVSVFQTNFRRAEVP